MSADPDHGASAESYDVGVRARSLVIGTAMLGLTGAGYAVLSDDDPAEVFCTAEGLIGPNGETYGRTGPHCVFADDEGNLATHMNGGTPICYAADSSQIVPCATPGAREPEAVRG